MKGIQPQYNGGPSAVEYPAEDFILVSTASQNPATFTAKHSIREVLSLRELSRAALLPSFSLLHLPVEMLSYLNSFLDPFSALAFAHTCQITSTLYSVQEREGLRLERNYLTLIEEEPDPSSNQHKLYKACLAHYYQYNVYHSKSSTGDQAITICIYVSSKAVKNFSY